MPGRGPEWDRGSGASGGQSAECRSCGRAAKPGARFCAGCGGALAAVCGACGAPVEHPAVRFCEQCGFELAAGSVSPSDSPSPGPLMSFPPVRPAQPHEPAIPGSFAAGRYQTRRFLGEGGRKRVYQAYDRALDREVAVAAVKTEGLDGAGLERVRREAQAMGRLGDHPHIVAVYDIGEDKGQPYIVTQYMAGGSVEDLLAQADGRRLAVAESLSIAEEVCEALEYAHSQGVIHRDVKPANVWLTGGGSTRLGDFGLAVTVQHSRLTTEGMMVGTVAYMAPEQALGRDVDARADLYSLGALLYECLTGRPPFVGPDAVAVISQQINTPPMPPCWHNPEVPQPLSDLLLELLAKRPEERPATAAEVRRQLENVRTWIASRAPSNGGVPARQPASTEPEVTSRSARLDRSRFVGRAEQLSALKTAVEAAMSGRSRLVMMVGEPGIGKTRLAEEVGTYARLRGASVLVGRCYEAESARPYLPFIEAIRTHVENQSPELLRGELGDGASDVSRLVSDIRRRLPDVPPAAHRDGEEERYRLFESVTSFLLNASKSQPLVLVLEDLHWADTPSVHLLRHLGRRMSEDRLLVLGTYRDAEVDRRHPVFEALTELRRDGRLERVRLQGLSREEVGELVDAMGDRKLGGEYTELVTALHRETDGNPFFLEEVARDLLQTGKARWDQGCWVIDAGSITSLAVPDGVRELIGRRLTRLSDPCNQTLAQASVLGRHFEFDVLAGMSELTEDELLRAIEEALSAQLILACEERRGEPVYTFVHALVRETLYEEQSLPRRQRLHRRAADAIEVAHARNLAAHVGALAVHHQLAGVKGDAAKAVQYSLAAGEAAQAVFAYEEAIQHWEAALEWLEGADGGIEQRARLLERVGDLKYTTGVDHEGSIQCLELALSCYDTLGDMQRVAQMHSRLGRDLCMLPSTMDVPRGLAHYRAAEAILSERGPSNALGYVYFGLASVGFWTATTRDGLIAGTRALEMADELGNTRLALSMTAVQANLLAGTGRFAEAWEMLTRVWREADRTDDVMPAFCAAWIVAYRANDLRDPQEMERWSRRELDTARLAQAPHPRGLLLDYLALARLRSGDVAEARRIHAELGLTRYTPPQLALVDGDWVHAVKLWTEQLEDDRRRGNRQDEWHATYWLAVVDALQGEVAGAEAKLVEAVAAARAADHEAVEVMARAELALVLADAGRPGEAEEHLEQCRNSQERGEDWRGLAGRIALAEAAALVAAGRQAAADAFFSSALETFRLYALPWDEAETLHRLGLARLGTGDRGSAVESLNQALEIYRSMGAGPRWIERVLADKILVQGVDPRSVGASIDIVASAALDERPDLADHAAPDGTVTLLFSDIEGSTAANERLGDRRWLEVLHAHNDLVRAEVANHGGFEVKSQGDGFMVAFSSARRGVLCAIGIQRAMRDHVDKHPDEPVAVRIGLHTGEAVKEGDDFFGQHVALAARVAGTARGGQILVSSLVKELTDTGEIDFGPPQEVELRGLSGQRRVHEVKW